jgi:hypothetical protein
MCFKVRTRFPERGYGQKIIGYSVCEKRERIVNAPNAQYADNTHTSETVQ